MGPLADSVRVLEGNYNGTPSHATTALDGIRRQFAGAQVTFDPGTNFLRQPELVPTTALSAPDGQEGLRGEYFAGKDFTGTPLLVRVDKTVGLEVFRPSPDALKLPAGTRNPSVRWTGFLTPPESGTYELGIRGSMSRLWLDDKLILEDMTLHMPSPKVATMPLERGHRYAVRLEYLQGGPGTRLVWRRVVADPIGEAVAAAKQADVTVAVVGITSDLEGEEMKVNVPGFKGGDRTSLDLPRRRKKTCSKLSGTQASRWRWF